MSVFDRGFLFADGVYEVTSVCWKASCWTSTGTRDGCTRSLNELDMAAPVTMDELLDIHRELMARNDLSEEA